MSGFNYAAASVTGDGVTVERTQVIYRPPMVRWLADGEWVERTVLVARRRGPRVMVLTLDGGDVLEVKRAGGCGCR